MNPRQRRGVLLMLLAGIGAVLVTLLVITYSSNMRAELGEMRSVLRLTTDVAQFERVTPDMVVEEEIPAAGLGEAQDFLSHASELEDGEQLPVAAVALNEGALLQGSMLTFSPDLREGEREIAIMVNAETGVAGKIDRGSVVDVYGVQQASEGGPPCAMRILTEQTVLEIGELTSDTDAETGVSEGVVPVTFRLTPQDTLRLTYAEAYMGTLRLGLVSPVGSGDPGADRYCEDTDEEDFDASGDHGPGDGASESTEQQEPEQSQESPGADSGAGEEGE